MMKRLILSLILVSRISFANCDSTLNACIEYSKAQTTEITTLRSHVDQLEKELSKDSTHDNILPSWFYFVGGIALGGALVFSFKGK